MIQVFLTNIYNFQTDLFDMKMGYAILTIFVLSNINQSINIYIYIYIYIPTTSREQDVTQGQFLNVVKQD